jgi:hypothetical protein
LIRFINLGKQIAQDENDPEWPIEFCFYDTLEARFMVIGNQQIFDSIEDLLEQIDDEDSAFLRRITNLIPPWVPKSKRTIIN